MVSGERFKNTYELLNLRALKVSPVNKIYIFQCMGKIFCAEFQRYSLKFHTKISYPYIQRYDFYTTLKLEELLDLRAHTCFETPPRSITKGSSDNGSTCYWPPGSLHTLGACGIFCGLKFFALNISYKEYLQPCLCMMLQIC